MKYPLKEFWLACKFIFADIHLFLFWCLANIQRNFIALRKMCVRIAPAQEITDVASVLSIFIFFGDNPQKAIDGIPHRGFFKVYLICESCHKRTMTNFAYAPRSISTYADPRIFSHFKYFLSVV